VEFLRLYCESAYRINLEVILFYLYNDLLTYVPGGKCDVPSLEVLQQCKGIFATVEVFYHTLCLYKIVDVECMRTNACDILICARALV
jgi:hypothetical protein